MIWNVADMLRGPFKPHEYGLIILPMTVVKRFHDCLLSTHKAVLEKYEEVKKFAVIDGFLTTASQYQFYNISKYTFDSLLADPENIEAIKMHMIRSLVYTKILCYGLFRKHNRKNGSVFCCKTKWIRSGNFVLRSIMPVIWMDSFLYYAMASSTEEFHLKSAILNRNQV